MRKFKIWLRAFWWDEAVYRVEYADGRETRLLRYLEAKSVAETFGGRYYIDYNA